MLNNDVGSTYKSIALGYAYAADQSRHVMHAAQRPSKGALGELTGMDRRIAYGSLGVL
jgi:cytochrome c551/c552